MNDTLHYREVSTEMMRLWQARAYAELPGTAEMTVPALEDHIRDFLERLIAALEAGGETNAAKSTRVNVDSLFAKTHGGQRAELLVYQLADLIEEFHILRQVAFQVLEKRGQLTQRNRDIILDAIEGAVKNASCEFAQNQKETQERFMLTVAHDLRNPLNVIQMQAWLLPQCLDRPPLCRQCGEKISRNAQRLNLMIGELLDVSRLRAGKGMALEMKETRLDLLARAVVEELGEIHGARLFVEAPESVTGNWNADGLRRIIENLSVNALKYGSPTGRVTIRVHNKPAAAILSVHNEGEPIPLETQTRLFQTYARAQSAGTKSGWGLGLALVKGMVDAHQGKVRVESAANAGTTFIVELPR